MNTIVTVPALRSMSATDSGMRSAAAALDESETLRSAMIEPPPVTTAHARAEIAPATGSRAWS